MLEFKYIEHGLLKSNQHGYTHRWEILINIYQSSIKTIGCFYIYLSRFVIAIHSTLGRRNANFGQAGADLGGGCRGCAPPPSRDDLRFSNTTGILQKKTMWFVGRDECTPS